MYASISDAIPAKQSWLYMLENDYTGAREAHAADRGGRRGRARHDARGDGPAARLRGRAPGAGGRGARCERQELRPGLGERQAGRRRARPGAARPRAVAGTWGWRARPG